MRKGLILAICAVLVATSTTYAGGLFNWFHPFRHRQCNQPVVCPQPVSEWRQYGVFKAHFGEDVDCPFHHNRCHSDHWVWGFVGDQAFYDVNGNVVHWIYWEREVNDPFHPGVGEDIEQVFKDLENDIANLFKKHHDRLTGPGSVPQAEKK